MQYVVSGLSCLGPSSDTRREFSYRVTADHPGGAGEAARELAKIEFPNNREISIWSAERAEPADFDGLALQILGEFENHWLQRNYHLEALGFSPDILSRDFGRSQGGSGPLIRYMHPGVDLCSKEIRRQFPIEIMAHLRPNVAGLDQQSLPKVIDQIFGQVRAVQKMESCGDHHAWDYGEPVIPVYFISADEAFKLSVSPDRVWEIAGR